MRHLKPTSALFTALLFCSSLSACGGGSTSDPTLASTQVVQAAGTAPSAGAAVPSTAGAAPLTLTPVVSEADAAQAAFTQAVTTDLKTAEKTPLTNSPILNEVMLPPAAALPSSGLIPDQAIVEKPEYTLAPTDGKPTPP